MRRIDRERARILKDEGVTDWEMTQDRGHNLYRICGHQVCASNSPKNQGHSLKNFRKDVRKLLTRGRHV